VLAPRALEPSPGGLAALAAGLTAASLLAGALVAARPSSVLLASRAMLVVDAGFVTLGAHVTGGLASPLHYAILLHLGAVTLLASARTGVVLALLDTLLLVGLRMGIVAGWWAETTPAEAASAVQELGIFLVVLWIVAVTTAMLTTVNRRELRRRSHDLDALSLLTERVERAARPAAVAQLLLDAVVSTYGLKRGVVVTAEGEQLSLLASSDVLVGCPDRVARSRSEGRTRRRRRCTCSDRTRSLSSGCRRCSPRRAPCSWCP